MVQTRVCVWNIDIINVGGLELVSTSTDCSMGGRVELFGKFELTLKDASFLSINPLLRTHFILCFSEILYLWMSHTWVYYVILSLSHVSLIFRVVVPLITSTFLRLRIGTDPHMPMFFTLSYYCPSYLFHTNVPLFSLPILVETIAL